MYGWRKAEMTPKTDTQVLLPKEVAFYIGGRTYVQKPLTLRRTTRFITAVADEAQKAVNSPSLTALLTTDLEGIDAVAALPALMQGLQALPDALPRLMAIVLTGDEQAADIDFLDENASLADALRVARVFVEQNDVEELVENFTVLRGVVTAALEKARTKTEE